MSPKSPPRSDPPGVLSRRELLRRGALGCAVAWSSRPALAELGELFDPAAPRVVEVVGENLFAGNVARLSVLDDMLVTGLRTLSGQRDAGAAWRAWLKDDDIIGIKFNGSGAETIGTSPLLAPRIVESLVGAGFDPQRIVLLEAGPQPDLAHATREPEWRFSGKQHDFGCGRDSFAGFVDQVTAIINVPFLKTHHSAVMSGCMKNLSHGLIAHPARFHGNGCDPAIGAIVAAPPIRTRLRLNIVNALRVVTDRGPAARAEDVMPFHGLILALDPVAGDAVGYDVLNRLRGMRKLRPLLPLPHVPPQLRTAHARGAGQFDLDRIDWRRMRV
ncbi:MAG: DUF362 domain-containing protein [Phycisphaerae bacterium]